MKKSKLIFCLLGLFFPGTGLNCFYLQDVKSFWGWTQFFALFGGFVGWGLLKDAHFISGPGWVLLTFGFIAIEASWLTTITLVCAQMKNGMLNLILALQSMNAANQVGLWS
jgi:hypothetical protein